MDERTIYGSVWLGSKEYILPIKILGYRVFVSANLNQPNFQEGDTVILNLNIANQNERNIKGFGTANYNGENITQNFYLAGYSLNIDFSNAERLKPKDSAGVYVSKVISVGLSDSLMVKFEGQGTFKGWVRKVEPDSVHYSEWVRIDTAGGVIITAQVGSIQYKVEFADTFSYLERINLRIYEAGGFRDTIIERFELPSITQQFIFPFDPVANLLFYGVYTETGRGLWLNTIYVFSANDTCNIITDKQVYKMGDTVFATVESPYNGKLLYSLQFYPFPQIKDSLWIDSLNNRFQFALPKELASGTYSIDFEFYIDGDTLKKFSSSQLFDVQGYQIIVTECRLDTNEYQIGDTMFIRFKLNSNFFASVIVRLDFVQNYLWYEGLCDTIPLDSGFNMIDLSAVVPNLERGPAFLNYRFYKDSLFLTYSSEGFMVYVPDTMPPVAQFIQIPQNTYNPNISHIVKITATDETKIYDTLFYHNGITLNRLSHQIKKGDTLIYYIPAQPRGTNLAYYIALKDSFGNKTRLPSVDYNQFWVLSCLPPSECTTDTINRRIEISWENPLENLIYHSGYPYQTKTDSIAVRWTPQYIPANLKKIKVFIEKIIPDTAILYINFCSVDQGLPGNEIYPGDSFRIGQQEANWIEFDIDSVPITGEIFTILSGQGIRFYGDGDDGAYRTLVKDNNWIKDSTFGNLLIQAGFAYQPDSIYYRVLREDSLEFLVIGDSLLENGFTDSLISGEKRYRYLVQTHYIIPDLNGTSPVLTQVYDYTPPVFGDSVEVIETDTSYLIGCEITDGIGVAIDSLIYDGIAVGHDSIVNDWYWWTIPKDRISENQDISGKDIRISDYQGNCSGLINQTKMSDKSDRYNKIEILKQVQNDRRNWGELPLGYKGGVIAYYFTAQDSAGNFARNPDTGYFYIVPHIPEGFSGHITKDTTWLTDILIKGDVWVDSGVTLTIGPGVKIRFIPNFDDEHSGIDSTRAEFMIRGKLELLGNDSMPVIFTSDALQPDKGDWYGIRFENPKPAIEMSFAEIDYAEIGLSYELNKPFKVKRCKISDCAVGVNSESKSSQIMEGEFWNNNQGAVINDGKLNLVKRCEFRNNITGLLLKGEEKGYKGIRVSENQDIREMIGERLNVKCETENGSGAIYRTKEDKFEIRSTKSFTPLDSEHLTGQANSKFQIPNGTEVPNPDEMLKQEQQDKMPKKVQNDREKVDEIKGQMALLFDNTFSDNDTGIIFTNSAIGLVHKNEILNNLIGVYITEDALPILGIKMSGQNLIEARFQMPDTSFAVYNNTKNYIFAEGNRWGTNNKDSIALFIYDYYDDSTKGVVDFEPYREETIGKGSAGIQAGSEEIIGYGFNMPSVVKGDWVKIHLNNFGTDARINPNLEVIVSIYDITGRLVKGMRFNRSANTLKINLKGLTCGVYFLQIRTEKCLINRKLVLLK
ncbi:MAG: T9SS type A sorting domain-containing protein [bacterium]